MAGSRHRGVFLNAMPLDLIRQLARQMDERGFHSAWFPEITFNDGLTPMAFVGMDTENLLLGSASISFCVSVLCLVSSSVGLRIELISMA